jgi:hypothetical protein
VAQDADVRTVDLMSRASRTAVNRMYEHLGVRAPGRVPTRFEPLESATDAEGRPAQAQDSNTNATAEQYPHLGEVVGSQSCRRDAPHSQPPA